MAVDTDGPSPGTQSPDERTRLRWLNRIPRDLALIIVGALLAVGSEEWRDARQRRARVDVAIASLRNELTLNRSLVAKARDHHRYMADTLGKLVALTEGNHRLAANRPFRRHWSIPFV